jgi:hypothetical protein
LFVFYSGHGDAESLHLKGTRLETRELRELVDGSGATVRILVVDACHSGGFTRRKGGHAGPAFAIDLVDHIQSTGLAILSSSTDGEDSQESERLRASFFTHYLASALRGAADDDNDGRITLSEAFSYASQRTIAATAQTAAGPQHPTYRYDLTGREDPVLTFTMAQQGVGSLRFPSDGNYVIQRRDRDGPMVAEVTVQHMARVVAVSPGEYFVTRRAPDHLMQGKFTVASGAAIVVDPAVMETTAYARVIRKGGTELRTSLGAFVTGGVWGGLGSFGLGPQVAAGIRIDRATFSAELRGHFSYASAGPTQSDLGSSISEVGAVALALRMFDVGRLSAGLGLGLGPVLRLATVDKLSSTATTSDFGVTTTVLGQAQYILTRRTYARCELAGLGYWFGSDPDNQNGQGMRLSWSLGFGVGAYF